MLDRHDIAGVVEDDRRLGIDENVGVGKRWKNDDEEQSDGAGKRKNWTTHRQLAPLESASKGPGVFRKSGLPLFWFERATTQKT